MKLVVLHGFLGSTTAWREVLRHTALDAEALVLPFHGVPPAHPTCASWQHAVETLTQRLPDEPCLLAGYSLGARLALGMSLFAPTRVRALMLVGVHAGLDRRDPAYGARVEFEERMANSLRASQTMENFVDLWERLPLFASQTNLPSELLADQRTTRMHHHPETLARAFTVLGTSQMPHYEPLVTTLPMPTWFVAGELDHEYRKRAEQYSRRAPRGATIVVPGSGHNPLVEAPEALGRLLTTIDHEVGA